MRWRSFGAGLAMLGMAAGPAWANNYAELSFQQKMDQSDLVIVGTVTAVRPDSARDAYDASATLHVVASLKGTSPNDLVVETRDRITESDPQCCRPGGTYVMFLRRGRNGRYYSVNGRFGMVQIGSRDGAPNLVIPAGD